MDFWNTQLSCITVMISIVVEGIVKFIDKYFNKRIDKVKDMLVKKSFEEFEQLLEQEELEYREEIKKYALKNSKYFKRIADLDTEIIQPI